MELRQLRYLDAVARRCSFTQAALDLQVWRAGERPTPAAQAFREHVLSTMRA